MREREREIDREREIFESKKSISLTIGSLRSRKSAGQNGEQSRLGTMREKLALVATLVLFGDALGNS